MKVGVQLPEVERVVGRAELGAIARAAEECGFDSIWVGDHLLYRGNGRSERGPWDCWTTLAWLAAITERVELGPLVACTAFHPPGILARQAATIDELSGGRFVAALGAGWNQEEFRAFGIPFDHHVSRFEEAFTIVRQLLAGERVTFDGRFHTAFWLAAAWGAFPVLTSYWVNALELRVSVVLAAVACFMLTIAQRRLSTPVRELRRRTVSLSGEQRLADGTVVQLDAARLAAPMEGALGAWALGVVLLAIGLVLSRLW